MALSQLKKKVLTSELYILWTINNVIVRNYNHLQYAKLRSKSRRCVVEINISICIGRIITFPSITLTILPKIQEEIFLSH